MQTVKKLWALIQMYRVPLLLVLVVAFASAALAFGRATEVPFTSCGKLFSVELHECWKTAHDARAGDITASLGQLSVFLQESPSFVNSCHSFAHEIGERAYADFKRGKEVQPFVEMQICDYGFYHGFITAFLADGGGPADVGGFCISMQQAETGGQKGYSRDACYHGIGHGMVTEHDPAAWVDPMAILQEALSVCRAAAVNEEDYLKCAGGSYNGMAYGDYGKLINPLDPFKICRDLTPADAPIDCYGNLASVVFNLTPNKDLQEAIDLGKKYAPKEFLRRIFATFGDMSARQGVSSENYARVVCERLLGEERIGCFDGVVDGMIQSATPEQKADRVMAFCSHPDLAKSDRHRCFEHALIGLGDFWSSEKVGQACETFVSSPYRNVCRDARPGL